MSRARAIYVVLALMIGCVPPDNQPGNQPDDQNTDGEKIPNLAAPPTAMPDDALIPTPAVATDPLLNEIRYDAPPEESQFVELKGVTVARLLTGLALVNDRSETYAIPSTVTPTDTNGIITIYFDGQNTTGTAVIHADRIGFLSNPSGFVTLQDANANQLDSVNWGTDRADAVRERNSGVEEMPAGASLARRPQSTAAFEHGDWFVAGTALLTPERPNRNWGVNMLFPLDGALVVANDLRVDWAFVQGPSQYHMQVATEPTFASTVADQTVIDGPVPLTLPVGGYYWRVQASFPDGSLADWSPINRFVVIAREIEGDPVPDDSTDKQFVTHQAIQPRKFLSHRVPQYFQHKDGHMLQLESDYPSGTRQAWDAPHPELNKSDPADNSNCARAVVSMINGYFASASDGTPNLTQDRIGLYIFRNVNDLGHAGPEFDFGYGRGLTDEEYGKALEFALGGPVTFNRIGNQEVAAETFLGIYMTDFRDQFWKDLGKSIESDKPLAISAWTGSKGSYMHAIVATGRFLVNGERFVHLNDPWYGRIPVPLNLLKVRAYWILPDARSLMQDEDDLRTRKDTDEDGVMDFDEEQRFFTDKNLDDSDRDCIDDMPEIRASVFNTKHGWGIYQARRIQGLVQLSDGSSRTHKRPEIQDDIADSDGGGLNDPMEDLNLNGQYEPAAGETDPFDPSDDARTITGHYRSLQDETDSENDFVTHTVQDLRTDYNLHVGADGKITGTVTVKQTFKNTRDFQSFAEDCPGPRHDELTWELNFDTPVEARFLCQGLTITSTVPHGPYATVPATFTDSCDGSSASSFGPVGTWGMTSLAPPFSIEGNGSVVYRQALTPVFPGSHVSLEWEITVAR